MVPHHGAATNNSHGWIYLTKPSKGIIFSAPMFSHHHHPTLAAMTAAIKVLSDAEAWILNDNEKLIYWDTAGRDQKKKYIFDGNEMVKLSGIDAEEIEVDDETENEEDEVD